MTNSWEVVLEQTPHIWCQEGEKTLLSSQREQKGLEETDVGCFPLSGSVRLWENPNELYAYEIHCLENMPCLEENILGTFFNGYILVTL